MMIVVKMDLDSNPQFIFLIFNQANILGRQYLTTELLYETRRSAGILNFTNVSLNFDISVQK